MWFSVAREGEIGNRKWVDRYVFCNSLTLFYICIRWLRGIISPPSRDKEKEKGVCVCEFGDNINYRHDMTRKKKGGGGERRRGREGQMDERACVLPIIRSVRAS